MKITKEKLKKLIKEELDSITEVGENPPLGDSPSAEEDTPSGTPDSSKMKASAQRLLKKLQNNAALKKQLDMVAKSGDQVGKQQLVAWWTKALGLDLQKDTGKIKTQAKRIGAV
jgi:hypothetical protein